MGFYLRGMALEVPDIIWQYWGIIEFMQENPGMYGLDEKREKLHDQICELYKIKKEDTKVITDNLNHYENGADLHFALLKLKKRN